MLFGHKFMQLWGSVNKSCHQKSFHCHGLNEIFLWTFHTPQSWRYRLFQIMIRFSFASNSVNYKMIFLQSIYFPIKIYYGQHQSCCDLPTHLQEEHKKAMYIVLVSFFKKSSQEQNRTQCMISMLLVSAEMFLRRRALPKMCLDYIWISLSQYFFV